jgi:protein involved in polysaccharide export with SLBB domain
MGKLGLLGVLVGMLWVSGCGTTSTDSRFQPLPGEDQQAAVEPDYHTRISPGEAITITFADIPYHVPPIEERVKEDGTITLIQNQTFEAAGKTRRQLEQEIRERYVPRYFVNMSVQVTRRENTLFYFVGGEVRNPGRQVYLGAMTVMRAIQSAGDFTDFASRRRVQLTRANGKVETINARDAQRDPSRDLPVYPGDSIHVPRSMW